MDRSNARAPHSARLTSAPPPVAGEEIPPADVRGDFTSSRRRWHVPLLLALATLTAALFFARQRAETNTVSELRPIAIPGTEIARKGGEFLFQTLVDHGVMYDRKECDAQGRCSPNTVADFATNAWRTLAFVGLAQASGSELDRVRLMDHLHRELTRTNFELGDMVGHHQLFEAYVLTGSLEIAEHIFRRAPVWLREARATRAEDAIEHLLPMLSCAMAKQLLFAANLLGREAVVARLQEEKLLPSKPEQLSALRADYRSQGLRLIDLTERNLARHGLPVADAIPEFKRQSCWVLWAKYAAYAATEDRASRDSVIEVLRRLKFRERQPAELRFSTLQDVLPCIHTLKDLETEDPNFRTDAIFLLQRFVIPQWDAPRRPLCDGDGGFIAGSPTARAKNPKCGFDTKFTSDTAWAVYLLSFFPEAFRIS